MGHKNKSKNETIIGEVLWFNREKGYGVAVDQNNIEYFIHHTNLPRNFPPINKGDLLVYSWRYRSKSNWGREAIEIEHLGPGVSTEKRSNRKPNHLEQGKSITTSREGVQAIKVTLLTTEKEKLEITPKSSFHQTNNHIFPKQIGHTDLPEGLKVGGGSSDPHNTNSSSATHLSKNYFITRVSNQMKDETVQLSSKLVQSWNLSYLVHVSDGCIIDRVKGVTYNGRQIIVAQLSIGEKLFLKREPRNTHDPNAIRVERDTGQQVGYIDRELASHLAELIDNCGNNIFATVVELTGGIEYGTYRGVRISIPIPLNRNMNKNYYGF